MEEVIQTLNEIVKAINDNSVPVCIAIIGTFVPIIISIAVFFQSYRQNKRHRELQEQMDESNATLQRELNMRDMKVQMHGDFLKVYNDFCYAQNVIAYGKDQVHVIFSNVTNMSIQWVNDINHASRIICQSVNTAKLLLPKSDTSFSATLESIYQKILDFQKEVNTYYHGGQAGAVWNNAWRTVSSAYGIVAGDYYSLMNNAVAYDAFLKLCANEKASQINDMIKETISLFEYDKFDILFLPYLQMNFDVKESSIH